jgi:hypothetical protein
MNIAILGWGSLIWDKRELKLKIDEWYYDGPILPIEFARISEDGRLTLVIKQGVSYIKVFYSISNYDNIDEAIKNLSEREKCKEDKIGYFVKENELLSPINFQFLECIQSWINLFDNIDAVIWTNLSIKFKDKVNLKYSSENVVEYLRNLPDDKQKEARRYIIKTPIEIKTEMRSIIEKELKWLPHINL